MAKQFYGEAANFPGAPENFDPSDPLADKVAAIAQREHVVREKMVKIETAKLLRERVQECYKMEGVNHYQNCKEVSRLAPSNDDPVPEIFNITNPRSSRRVD